MAKNVYSCRSKKSRSKSSRTLKIFQERKIVFPPRKKEICPQKKCLKFIQCRSRTDKVTEERPKYPRNCFRVAE